MSLPQPSVARDAGGARRSPQAALGRRLVLAGLLAAVAVSSSGCFGSGSASPLPAPPVSATLSASASDAHAPTTITVVGGFFPALKRLYFEINGAVLHHLRSLVRANGVGAFRTVIRLPAADQPAVRGGQLTVTTDVLMRSNSISVTTPIVGGASGKHSLADVKAALRAVGLTGLRPNPADQIMNGRGVDPAKLLGGFSYFDTGDNGSLISIEIAVASDPSVFRPIKAAVVAQSRLGPYNPKFARAGNVLIFSTTDHPTFTDRARLADIQKLVAYLNTQ